MTHNARLATDSFYATGVAMTASWWTGLTTAYGKVINGDVGGNYTPLASIAIGGAGLQLAGATTITKAGGITGTAPGWLVHGDSDYILLGGGHTSQTRVIVTSCAGFFDISDAQATMWHAYLGTLGSLGTGAQNYNVAQTNAYLQSAHSGYGARILVPLDVHHGAIFAQAVLKFTVTIDHTLNGAPALTPQLRIYQVDSSGNVTNLIQNGTNGGFLSVPPPASGTAWYNSGATQSLTATIFGMTLVDTTQYTYWAEIVDESGANALYGNVYQSVACTFSSIPDLRPG